HRLRSFEHERSGLVWKKEYVLAGPCRIAYLGPLLAAVLAPARTVLTPHRQRFIIHTATPASDRRGWHAPPAHIPQEPPPSPDPRWPARWSRDRRGSRRKAGSAHIELGPAPMPVPRSRRSPPAPALRASP